MGKPQQEAEEPDSRASKRQQGDRPYNSPDTSESGGALARNLNDEVCNLS